MDLWLGRLAGQDQDTTHASIAWSLGPRRAASPLTRVLERDSMELGRFALPHGQGILHKIKGDMRGLLATRARVGAYLLLFTQRPTRT